MKLLADECLAGPIVLALRASGHDVLWIREMQRGLDDPLVLESARTAGRVLVTEDHDFGELTIRRHRGAVGVVVVETGRFRSRSTTIAEQVCKVIDEHADSLIGQLTIIEPGRVRTRRLGETAEGN